jgi:hypothetical protein
MTEISRLKSNPVCIVAVLGFCYFALIALLTAAFVRLAVTGYFTIYLLGFLVVCVFSARMCWTWMGLVASAAALNYRGLYIADGSVAYISPRIRAFPLADIVDAHPFEVKLGPVVHRFLQFELRSGGRWRLPAFMLAETPEKAADRVKAALTAPR